MRIILKFFLPLSDFQFETLKKNNKKSYVCAPKQCLSFVIPYWRKRQDVFFEYKNEVERKRFPIAPFQNCFIVLPYERIRSIKYPVKRKSYNRRNESELKKFCTGHITEISVGNTWEMYREQYGSWTMLWCTKVPA